MSSSDNRDENGFPKTNNWYQGEQMKPFLTQQGDTTPEGQKAFGQWERQNNYGGQHAGQLPHESWNAFLTRINEKKA